VPDLLARFKGILLLKGGKGREDGLGRGERNGKGDRGGRKGKAGGKAEPGEGKGGKGNGSRGLISHYSCLKTLAAL